MFCVFNVKARDCCMQLTMRNTRFSTTYVTREKCKSLGQGFRVLQTNNKSCQTKVEVKKMRNLCAVPEIVLNVNLIVVAHNDSQMKKHYS